MRTTAFTGLILLFGITAHAQDHSYRENDTAVVIERTAPAEEKTGSDSREQDEYEKNPDTALYNLRLKLSYDSILAIKNEEAYAYAKYLDSLLKKRDLSIEQKRNKSPDPGIKKNGEKNSNSNENTTYKDPPASTWLDKLFGSGIFQTILIILAISFVVFVIARLFISGGMFKRSKKAPESKTSDVPEEEEVTAASDVDRLIANAVAAGNFRLAIRYWYLKTLHLLNGKNMISMAQDKTNYQYVNELRDPALRNDFASVTLTYEYAWYGEFEVDRDLYGKIETGFSAFVKKV